VVTLSVITTASLFEAYLLDQADLLSWPLLPVAIGVVGGGIQGSVDSEALQRGTRGAALGAVVGAGLGIFVGEALIDDEKGPWTGLLIGAGAGVITGWILGSLDEEDDGGLIGIPDSAPLIAFGIPIGEAP